MSTSMTKGSPLKLMLQFALPLLMGNLLQQTYNIIDAAIVGQILGADALASVGSSSSVQFLVLGFCIGCCAGFGVPVARYFGAGCSITESGLLSGFSDSNYYTKVFTKIKGCTPRQYRKNQEL